MNTRTILGVSITNEKKDYILEYIIEQIKKDREKFYVVTPNPEIIVYATKHPEFRKILNEARIGLCDGIGVRIAGYLLDKSFRERLSGVDLLEGLVAKANDLPVTVGFLGAGPGVARRTAECLMVKYPRLKISFIGSEWNHNSVDILFVALGYPKQEEWMAKNLPHIPVKVAIGVGGAFDYISGEVKRAPKIVRDLGFEWLYRLIRQPWRWKRQLSLLEFGWMVLKEKIKIVSG